MSEALSLTPTTQYWWGTLGAASYFSFHWLCWFARGAFKVGGAKDYDGAYLIGFVVFSIVWVFITGAITRAWSEETRLKCWIFGGTLTGFVAQFFPQLPGLA